MARSFNGTTNTLQAALDLTAFSKLSVSFWLWWNSYANDDHMAMEFGSNSSGGFYVDPNSSANGGSLRLLHNISGGLNSSEYTRPSAAAWHHLVAIYDHTVAAASEVTLYLDGTLATPISHTFGTDTSGNFGNLNLSLMSRNAASLFGAGRMAELALYPGEVLNAAEAQALALGVNPRLIRPDSNPHHWPLWGLHSPEINLRSGGASMTVTGATQTNHAPVRPFTRLYRATIPDMGIPPQTLSATAAQGALSAIAASLMPGAVTMNVTAAQSALQAVTAALTAGATTVLLTAAEAQALAGLGVLSAGAVTLTGTAAQAVLSAVTAVLSRGGPAVQYRVTVADVNEYRLRVEQ